MKLIGVIAFVAMAIAFFSAIAFVGRWILGPVDRAARTRQAPIRYSIADFLCLFVIFQIPLAIAHQFSGEETRALYWFFSGATWIVAPVIWFAATRALSQAGIRSGKHRWAFMGLIVPLAYYGLLPFVGTTIFVVARIFTHDGPPILGNPWFMVVWPALGAFLFFGGLYTRWMVRRAEMDLNQGDTEDKIRVESSEPDLCGL